jgi:8-oxo-dGTP diphosphatase
VSTCSDDLWPLLDPSGFPDRGRPRFCARCGSPTREPPDLQRPRPTCSPCGWTYYAKNAVGAGALVDRAGAVLLVQRAHDPYAGSWTLPAGYVEYGEDAAETAVREILEERALAIRLTGIFGYYFATDDPRNPCDLVLYRASLVVPAAHPRAGDDAAAVGWFAPDVLPAAIAFEAHRRALADWRERG